MSQCLVCKGEYFEPVVLSKDFCVSQEDFKVVKCNSCGFAFTENAPDAASIGMYYEHADYISHTDTKEGLMFKVYHWVRSIMLRRKLGYIQKVARVKTLLDIGSGTGYFVNHVQQAGLGCVGFEPDEVARNQAKKNFNIDLSASLESVIENSNRFDAISMWHVLEHVHELDAYFEKFRILLEEKGVLAIAVPNYTSYDASFYKKYWAAYDLPKHLWHFSPSSLKLLAKNHGFKHIKSYAMPYDSYYISLLSEQHKKSGFFGKIRAMFIGELSYLNALINSEKASSVVYIFEKK